MITKNREIHISSHLWVRKTFIISLLFFILATYGANNLTETEKKSENKIYPNIYINGKSVAGYTKAEAQQEFTKLSEDLNKVFLVIKYNKEPVATFSAATLALRPNLEEITNQAYLIGRGDSFGSKFIQKFATFANLKKYYLQTNIIYNKSSIIEFLNIAEDLYGKPAKNALFQFDSGRVSSFRPEENGLKIETTQILNELDHAINNLNSKVETINLDLKVSVIKPEISLTQINNFGIEELIGEGKSDFTHSIGERIYNLTLASTKFNGILIPAGKELSFNEEVGDISSLTGYKPAYIIKNGKTILGDGGGVCQVSTTLFRAALNTGLPILERQSHDYRVGYYENDSQPGMDATVFAPSPDLKIKNNTPASILIQTEIDNNNNLLIFRLYGKKDNRKVEISPVRVWDSQPPPSPRYQEDPTLKRGVTRQIDFAAWGAKTAFDYRVYQNGKIEFEKTFLSNYRPWAAVFLTGTAD